MIPGYPGGRPGTAQPEPVQRSGETLAAWPSTVRPAWR